MLKKIFHRFIQNFPLIFKFLCHYDLGWLGNCMIEIFEHFIKSAT